jgi:hypothetical protein
MKKAIGLFLGALLAVSMAGCDGDDGNSGGSGGSDGGSGGSDGGSGGSDGGSGGSMGGAGGMMSSLSCDAYCDAVQANCTGDVQQYGDKDTCLTVCATFPVGMKDATDGNSLGCRTYHGGMPAMGDPGTHCPHGGPLGGGVCGADECANFCAIAVAICGEQATPPYADEGACMTACMGFPGTDMVPFNTMATAGDSLACRMYHLSVASTSDANKDTHCPHIAADSPTCL